MSESQDNEKESSPLCAASTQSGREAVAKFTSRNSAFGGMIAVNGWRQLSTLDRRRHEGTARNKLDNLGFKCAPYWVAPD